MHFKVTFFLSFGVQSCFSCPLMHFKVTFFFSFGIQSHCTYPFRHLESPYSSCFWRSKSCLLICIMYSHNPRYSHSLELHVFAFRGSCLSSVSSPGYIALLDFLFRCSWHSPLSSRRMFRSCRLGTLHLLFSYSSLRVVSFWHILPRTSEWFDRYSSLIWSFESLLETFLEGAWVLSVAFETFFRHPFLLGLEPLCSSVSLSEFMSHWCLCGGLLGSSVEFTSLHSLFTLAFHFSVHIPYTCELYRRGAYL